MYTVIDTNVLVSGLMKPDSLPGRVIDLLLVRGIIAVYDLRIINEYTDVLCRPKFKIPPVATQQLINFLEINGQNIIPDQTHFPIDDPSDLPFAQCAHTLDCPLVTGNLKHYRKIADVIDILSPREFMDYYLQQGMS